ncbi:fungal specific transcription factor domain-containing protein [Sarocladium implicatum]|nr:fungal specific transcription factor domain-containing protein [Sarocladium implicatum]
MPSDKSEVKSGRLIEDDKQMIYVSPDHWAAIHDEITKLKAHVELDDFNIDADGVAEQGPERGLMLLEGLCPPCSLEEVLFDIPPRLIADRLVSKYFTSRDRLIVLHGPSFLRDYHDFWNQPTAAPPAWVAMLFGVMLGGALIYARAGERLPEGLPTPGELLETFQRRSAECLVLSNYTSAPGKHTLEALLLHGAAEFFRRPDNHVGLWALGGVAIRLALRMGYHRDPSHYPHFTPFEGEMRRRMWGNIRQMDCLTSYQVGLPSMIQERHSDCLPPRNLFDEDLTRESTELPPSRAETEMTPVLYQIVKVRLLKVFDDIFDQTSLTKLDGRDYDRVAALDKRLSEAIASVPPGLRLSSTQDSLMVHPYVIIRQYNIELLGQKARCILHRQFMTKSYHDDNAKFAYSRKACLNSAMALLKHQMNILAEVQSGGLLFGERWFITSLEDSDFLLASMIVLLEVVNRGKGAKPNDDSHGLEEVYSTSELVEAVKKSQEFWYLMRERNAKAMQAYKTMSSMLARIIGDAESAPSVPSTTRSGNNSDSRLHGSVMAQPSETSGHYVTPETTVAQSLGGYEPQLDPPTLDPPMTDICDMLISPALVDWEAWESYMQRPLDQE